jgi:hypothetical protein
MNMFRDLVASDDAVKAVFDHFRNIGIAGAVLATGAWTLTHPATRLLLYMTWLSGGALCVLGGFLFFVAERHGHRKFQEANVSWYWELAALLVYAFATFALFTAAALRIELH